jgi:hypothetical protein
LRRYRLLYHCHRAMFAMLSSWLLYGRLADRFGEFFVREQAQYTGSQWHVPSFYPPPPMRG